MSRRCYYSKNNQHNNIQQQRTMFLPIMICSRSSLKDVVKPQPKRNARVSAASATTAKHAPPIRCIRTVNYRNLGRLFSAKKCPAADPASVARSDLFINEGSDCDIGSKCADLDLKPSRRINVAELDPPLPVVKKGESGEEARESLWKRRSRGFVALGSLEVQPIIHGGATTVPARTV